MRMRVSAHLPIFLFNAIVYIIILQCYTPAANADRPQFGRRRRHINTDDKSESSTNAYRPLIRRRATSTTTNDVDVMAADDIAAGDKAFFGDLSLSMPIEAHDVSWTMKPIDAPVSGLMSSTSTNSCSGEKQVCFNNGQCCSNICGSNGRCEASYQPTGTCSTSSIPCSSDEDCSVRKCSGGLTNGDTCISQSDCPDAIAGICEGGTNNGLICTTHNDNLFTGCPNTGSCRVTNTGRCVNVLDDVCVDTLPPVKVYILTGQSNNRGQGSILHGDPDSNSYTYRQDLNTLIANAATSPLYTEYGITYSHLGPGTTNTGLSAAENPFAERDDVFIHCYNYEGADDGTITSGKLGLGYGQNPLTDYNPKFGPEVGLGWTLGDADKHPIFLIKVGWGGKSLSTDFRPPSATCVPLGAFGPNSVCTNTAESWNGTCCAFGEYYDITLDRIKASISKIEAGDFDSLIPGFSARGLELAGFLYFQGFNDVINQEKVDEHEELLKQYMNDMRSEEYGLNVTDLPFVIGQLGMHGLEKDWSDKEINHRVNERKFKVAQANACNATPNAKLAKTAQYMYKPTGHYHYGDRADTVYAMGVSMGETMRDMVY